MNAIPDKFAQWDAAYVLGALSPAERREFEEHLASCPACQAAVSELAALPGLLAQISPADAAMLSLADDGAAYDNDFSFNSGWGLAMYRASRNRIARNKLDWCIRGYSHGVVIRRLDGFQALQLGAFATRAGDCGNAAFVHDRVWQDVASCRAPGRPVCGGIPDWVDYGQWLHSTWRSRSAWVRR